MTAVAWAFVAGFGTFLISAALCAAAKRADEARTRFANETSADWEEE